MAPIPVRLAALGLLALASRALAETATLELHAGQPAEFTLNSPVDDRNFQDPRAYQHQGTSTRVFIRRLTLTNTGATPLTGPLLVVNGRDWSSAEALRRSLDLPPNPALAMPRLFSFWRDHLTHADHACEGAKEPLALLNFWSYGLCGDSTVALSRLATHYGIPARKIPLNGHVAAEYFYDDAWHVFDTDQNASYLRLDNRTFASAADLRVDPFLARRTKVLGRYAPIEAGAMAFNTALHEYLAPREEKPTKSKTPPAAVRADVLQPGEQMIIHAAEPPEAPVGRAALEKWGPVRESTLRVVEWVLRAGARRDAAGKVNVATGFPILRAINHTTGETIEAPAGRAVFEIAIATRSADDRISVFTQRARASLPLPQRGRNTVLLAASESKGIAKLETEWDRPGEIVVPKATAELADAAPSFRLRSEPAADQLWWQISSARDFHFVAPNFDGVIAATDTLRFDPLTSTFFNPGETYYLRLKARRDGVWSEWSAPVEFRVEKPARPAPLAAAVVGEKLRLSWPDAGTGTEYLVFGSNRLDFLPEPFAAEEIVVLREQIIEQQRPNRNLVATTSEPALELVPEHRFYRVIARRGGVLSVPSELLATPSSLAAKLPPATVLQNRWKQEDGRDVHFATELPLP